MGRDYAAAKDAEVGNLKLEVGIRNNLILDFGMRISDLWNRCALSDIMDRIPSIPNPDKPEKIATKEPRHKDKMFVLIKLRVLAAIIFC